MRSPNVDREGRDGKKLAERIHSSSPRLATRPAAKTVNNAASLCSRPICSYTSAISARKRLDRAVEQLPLPQADLGGVDAELAGQFAGRPIPAAAPTLPSPSRPPRSVAASVPCLSSKNSTNPTSDSYQRFDSKLDPLYSTKT